MRCKIILVTGGAEFIGTNLCNELRFCECSAFGYEVIEYVGKSLFLDCRSIQIVSFLLGFFLYLVSHLTCHRYLLATLGI